MTTRAYSSMYSSEGSAVPQNLASRADSVNAVRKRSSAPRSFARRANLLAHDLEPFHYSDIRPRADLDGARDVCGSWLVLRKDAAVRRAWSLLVALSLVYIGTVFVYRLAFITFRIEIDSDDGYEAPLDAWGVVDTIITVIFWTDLVVNFFLSYNDENGHEVVSLRLIAAHYLSTYFFINLLSCIPESVFGVIVNSFYKNPPPSINQLARTLRLRRALNLTKFIRLSQLSRGPACVRAFLEARGLSILNLMCGLLWVVHMLACGWYIIAALHDHPEDTWVARRTLRLGDHGTLVEATHFDQWVHAMYFILTVFTTVGFGDISALTIGEIIYVCIIMAIGAVVHSVTVGEVIRLVTSNDRVQAEIGAKLDLVDAFAEHTTLDRESKREMQTWVRTSAKHWASRRFSKEDMAEMFSSKCMPRSLVGKLPLALFEGKLLQNDFLHVHHGVSSIPPRLPITIALASRKAEYKTGDVLFWAQDYATSLFFVMRGVFAYVAKASKKGGLPLFEPRQTVEAIAANKGNRSSKSWLPGSRSTSGLGESGLNASPYQTFSFGTYFGDMEVIMGCQRKTTARCESCGQVLIIMKDDLKQLADQFPHFYTKWVTAASRRERLRAKRQLALTSEQTYREHAARTIARVRKRFLDLRRSEGVDSSDGGLWNVMSTGVVRRLAAVHREELEEEQVVEALGTLQMAQGVDAERLQQRVTALEQGMAKVDRKLDAVLAAVSTLIDNEVAEI